MVAIEIGRGHEREPLKHYIKLMTTFATLSTTAFAVLRRRGVEMPSRVPLADVALLGLATSRISRLVTRDKVTRAVRAPFTEVEPSASPQEVKERPKPGNGMVRAIGELVTCPRCVAMWASLTLTVGYLASPRMTRAISMLLASAAISDWACAKVASAAK